MQTLYTETLSLNSQLNDIVRSWIRLYDANKGFLFFLIYKHRADGERVYKYTVLWPGLKNNEIIILSKLPGLFLNDDGDYYG